MSQTRIERAGAIRPTLFIGLGGTGKEVLLRLRRKFYEEFDRPGLPCVAYLWIDTDTRDVLPSGEPMDEIFEAVKFTEIERIPILQSTVGRELSHIFDNPENYPHIHQWLYQEVNRYGCDIGDGAGNVRAIGRLTFFNSFSLVSERIKQVAESTTAHESIQATKDIFARWGAAHPEFDDTSRQVFVIFSVAGGTGGGTFLDIAFLLRDLSKQFNLFDRITGICVLPNVFFSTPGDEQAERSFANAYAALKELEYYTIRRGEEELQAQTGSTSDSMMTSDFLVEWQRGEGKKVIGPPFQVVYILEKLNEANISLKSRSEFFRMIAESLYMDFMPGVFSTEKRSSYSNVSQYLAGRSAANIRTGSMDLLQEFARRYATFGMAKIEVPLEALRSACAAQLAHDILRYWTRPFNDPDPLGVVQRDIGERGLDVDHVAQRFGTDWKEKLSQAVDQALRPLREKNSGWTRTDVESVRQALNEIDTNYLSSNATAVRADVDVLHGLRVKSQTVETDLKDVMQKWLNHCLDEPNRGLRGLLAEKGGYLHHMTEQLGRLFLSEQSECVQRRNKAERDVGAWQAERDSLLGELVDAVTSANVSILAVRPFTIETLTEKLKDAEMEYLCAKVETFLYGLCKHVVEQATAFLAQQAAELPAFLNALDAMAGPFLQKKEDMLRPGQDVLFIRVFDQEKDWPKFYMLGGQPVDPGQEARTLLASGFAAPKTTLFQVFELWRSEGREKLAGHIKRFCEERFTEDFRAHRRDEDVFKHPQVRNTPKRDWALRLVEAALPRTNRRARCAGIEVPVVREAYLGLARGQESDDSYREFVNEVRNALIARGFSQDKIRVHDTNNRSEIFLYTVSYAFPLPTMPTISSACHGAYYTFYRKLKGMGVTNKHYNIPVHLDKRWEGFFDDLIELSGTDAQNVKEALEILLFGTVLRVVWRNEHKGIVEYGYKRQGFRIVDESLGNRKEAIEALRGNQQLRELMRSEIQRREQNLEPQQVLAYDYALTYLSTLPQFQRGTPEHTLLEQRFNVVRNLQRNKGVTAPERPQDSSDRTLQDWIQNQPETKDLLQFSETGFPVFKDLPLWLYEPTR